MNAVIYARFSSDKQTEDSIEAQIRACQEYAARHNLFVTDTYISTKRSAAKDPKLKPASSINACSETANELNLTLF